MINNSPKDNLEILCDNLAEAGSFYEGSLIQMPVRFEDIHYERLEYLNLDSINY